MTDNRIEKLYEFYGNEMSFHQQIGKINEDLFENIVTQQLEGYESIDLIKEGRLQAFFFYRFECDDKGNRCFIPSFGYWSEDEKSTVNLFQNLAENLLEKGKCRFIVQLHAHDYSTRNAFAMMQFFIMSECGVSPVENSIIMHNFDIRLLTKEDVEKYWPALWQSTDAIIRHLKHSPIFYEGKEFTEEEYHQFYMNEDTQVIAAFEKEKIIGIIEVNKEPEMLYCGMGRSCNVGEIYVALQYRKTGLSAALLNSAFDFAEKAGYSGMWVKHSTANPNGRAFWNRTFDTVSYETVRDIKPAAES